MAPKTRRDQLTGPSLVFPAATRPLQEPGVVALRPLRCRRLVCVLLLLLLLLLLLPRLPLLLPGIGALDPPRSPPGTSPRRPVTWQGSLQATTRTIEHIPKWIGPAAAESPPHHTSSSLVSPSTRPEGGKKHPSLPVRAARPRPRRRPRSRVPTLLDSDDVTEQLQAPVAARNTLTLLQSRYCAPSAQTTTFLLRDATIPRPTRLFTIAKDTASIRPRLSPALSLHRLLLRPDYVADSDTLRCYTHLRLLQADA